MKPTPRSRIPGRRLRVRLLTAALALAAAGRALAADTSAAAAARQLFDGGRYDEAFAIIDELIAGHPDNLPAKYQLGRLAAITGRNLDRGAAALQAYLQYSPRPGEPEIVAARWRLGMVREKLGDKAAARAEYEAALRAAPDFAMARDALARLR